MNGLKTQKEKKCLWYTYLTFMMNGLLALSLGSLLPFIRESAGLSYAFAGMIVSLHSVGNLLAGFAAGIFPAVIGKRKNILLFNACYALSYLLIVAGGNAFCLALAYFMTGLARGASSNFANDMVNSLAPGKASYLNGLHAMFSVGAFSFPVFLTILTRSSVANWMYACYAMVGMGILSWLLYYRMPMEKGKAARKEAESGRGTGQLAFFKEPLFYLCTLILFFYLCAEQGVIGWLITYFVDTGLLTVSLSQLMASMLWIMMLTGRLTTAWAVRRAKKEHLLLLMSTGAVCFFFCLLRSENTLPVLFGIMGFGFSMAGIYPTTVSFCGTLIQKYAIAWSFILTLASFGSILMPAVIGRVAQYAGIAYAMGLVAIAVAVDLILIAILNLYISRQAEKNADAL